MGDKIWGGKLPNENSIAQENFVQLKADFCQIMAEFASFSNVSVLGAVPSHLFPMPIMPLSASPGSYSPLAFLDLSLSFLHFVKICCFILCGEPG